MSNVQQLRAQIEQLDQLHRDGLLSDELHRSSRQQLEQSLVAAVLQTSAAPAPSPAAAPSSPAPVRRQSAVGRTTWAGVAAFILLAGGAGYAWKGAPAAWTTAGAGTAAMLATSADGAPPAPQQQAPHALGNDQMLEMVQTLAKRLQAQPEDPEGWAMLARSYATLGRHAEAQPAYAKALELSPADAALMADYADTLALQQGRMLQGKPLEWVRKALAADPRQPKALLLAGTEAFDRKAHAEAAGFFERALQSAAPGSSLGAQARSALEDARQAGGLPASPTPAPQASGDARIQGRLSLAPALAAQVKPDDTVFVFARPAEGARMPLAVLKRKASELPLDFVLDDSLAMSPQARLSGAAQVVVSARISRSGQAQPQPGDLQAQPSAPLALGSTGVTLQISQTVR
ncbi:tetratricopeptide repeat protein [Roseateles sp. DB2]|uniref:tetratricopeptide repeat protein n=1 Tax=Roseateles sp. DB2 TaxID=3453717 RepID=UPI003EE97426